MIPFRLLRHFTVQSQRNKVPKLLRDPKFTRHGIIKKKAKSYQYDLTQPHIINPHLYYDESVDKKAERLIRRENQRVNRSLPSPNDSQRSLQDIINETLRRDILDKPSKRILINLIELESRFPNDIDKYRDVAAFATKKICLKPVILSLRELGISISFANKYCPHEKAIWEKLRDSLFGKIEGLNYKDETILGNSQEENFANSLAFTISKCQRLGLKIDFLLNSAFRNLKPCLEQIESENFAKLISALFKGKKSIADFEIPEDFLSILKNKIPSLNYIDSIEILSGMSMGKIFNEEIINSLGKQTFNVGKKVINGLKKEKEITSKELELFSQFAQSIANLRIVAGTEVKNFLNEFYKENSNKFGVISQVFLLQSFFLLRTCSGELRNSLLTSIEQNFNEIPSNKLTIILAASGKKLEGLSSTLQLKIAKGLSNSFEKILDRNSMIKSKIELLASSLELELTKREFEVLKSIANA